MGGRLRSMATGQGSMHTKETRSSLPTMSKERMGKSYSIRGYMTQCTTCMTHAMTKPMVAAGRSGSLCVQSPVEQRGLPVHRTALESTERATEYGSTGVEQLEYNLEGREGPLKLLGPLALNARIRSL